MIKTCGTCGVVPDPLVVEGGPLVLPLQGEGEDGGGGGVVGLQAHQGGQGSYAPTQGCQRKDIGFKHRLQKSLIQCQCLGSGSRSGRIRINLGHQNPASGQDPEALVSHKKIPIIQKALSVEYLWTSNTK